jgi:hypothetical protein
MDDAGRRAKVRRYLLLVGALVVAFLAFALTAPVARCSSCEGTGLLVGQLRRAGDPDCPRCGGDGRLTLREFVRNFRW